MDNNKTYWNSNGKYEKEYNQLWEQYVPSEGYTYNKYINALISMSKMYYDVYNNGLCNEDNLYDDFYSYISAIKEELNVDNKVISNVLRKRYSLEMIEEAIYVWDEENECETDEVDYYEEQEVESFEELENKDYEDYELMTDAVIELVWNQIYKSKAV